jgi:hypothetical protein
VIDVERSQPAPSSLTAQKSWRGQDVIDRLFEDFLGKCYLCEKAFFGKGSFEVDHRCPRDAGGAHFEWANLFPVCGNCNGRRSKGWPDGGLLDPAGGHRVEARISQTLEYVGDDELVPVFGAVEANDAAAANTARELDHIHNDRRAPGRYKAADLRRAICDRLLKIKFAVLEYKQACEDTPHDEQCLRQHERHIRRLVARDAPFTMLVRSAIRRYVPPELFD